MRKTRFLCALSSANNRINTDRAQDCAFDDDYRPRQIGSNRIIFLEEGLGLLNVHVVVILSLPLFSVRKTSERETTRRDRPITPGPAPLRVRADLSTLSAICRQGASSLPQK